MLLYAGVRLHQAIAPGRGTGERGVRGRVRAVRTPRSPAHPALAETRHEVSRADVLPSAPRSRGYSELR